MQRIPEMVSAVYIYIKLKNNKVLYFTTLVFKSKTLENTSRLNTLTWQ